MKTKEALREEIWALMEKERVALFPGAQGRIPNFVGAESCARLLAESFLWKRAKVIKVNPDSPQRAIRRMALEQNKILYMAVPRLRSPKPFIELNPKRLKASAYGASSIKGAATYGRPASPDEMEKIDLIVCGSVAVNRRGARVGKGGGYSDLEYALLRESGKVTPETPIVTSVHALQVLDGELPMTEHDIPINAIITPQELIDIRPRYPKPKGIYWEILPPEKIDGIPVLKERKATKRTR
ncbi:MAG: 5-formyltetrahydrofolate cyclo-ligase [Deltaproteobacteria bacterium]|nr:5-formyltetrahydrofolate cyclo-ligase [Deltaproteobacteria bacterium]